MDTRPIGIFDSGVGGLTVVREVLKELPNEKIVYFGDTARVPYGGKSKETVTKFSRQDIHFLLSKDVKAIIIACNTVSSNSLDILQEEFDIPLFGVVNPGVAEALRLTKNKKVGIIGTDATIRSGAYEKLIKQADKDIEVFSKSCPLFVPLVEEGWTENEISYLTANKYLADLIETGIDSLVLGCTHYPLLKHCLKVTVGDNITLVDPAHATALVVKDYLIKHRLLNEDGDTFHLKHRFFVSDMTDKFDLICKKALNQPFTAKHIDIETY